MNDKLKPCPVCGSSDLYIAVDAFVFCENCRTEGPVSIQEGPSSDKLWNTRLEEPPE